MRRERRLLDTFRQSIFRGVSEITLNVERCEETGVLTASRDEPDGRGGITTQAGDLTELHAMVKESVLCHFEPSNAPAAIRFHFGDDPVLATR